MSPNYRALYAAAVLVPAVGYGLFTLTTGTQVSHEHLQAANRREFLLVFC